MELSICKENKTGKYLSPLLKRHKPYVLKVVEHKDTIKGLAKGINDMFIIDNTDLTNHIFVLTHVVDPDRFEEFIDWLRDQSFYGHDYPFGNLEDNNHMLVIELPNVYSMGKFLESKFSEIMPPNLVEELISKDKIEVKKVLLNATKFKQEVADRYNVDIDCIVELDSLVDLREEIFNFDNYHKLKDENLVKDYIMAKYKTNRKITVTELFGSGEFTIDNLTEVKSYLDENKLKYIIDDTTPSNIEYDWDEFITQGVNKLKQVQQIKENYDKN